MKKEYIVLILIIVLAFFLRIYNLHISPPGFNADEAALGYNAYSIINTGKDEWGEPFPLVFKSFSDYKPGLYVYLAIPFVSIIGLNELAVRLPSIILGALSVLFIYLLSMQIFRNRIIALSSAFLLAVSPWHVHYSRGAWETNIATFFILIGVWAFLYGLQRANFLYLSAISFLAAMYSYQSPRLIVPLLVLFLGLTYWKKLFFTSSEKKSFNKRIIGPIIVSLVLLVPLAVIVTSSAGLARFQGVSIFTDIGPGVRVNEDRGEHANPSDLEGKIYHNKLTAYGLNFISHYTDHFSPDFLFINGDPLGRNKIPDMGQMYLFEMITLIFGLYLMFSKKIERGKVIFIWLLVAPVAASLTYQTPHALRAANLVIPLALISGAGLGFILEKLLSLRSWSRWMAIAVGGVVILFFVTRFFHQYFVHLPKQYALEWQNGFAEMAAYAFANKDKYEKVLITDRYDQPYIMMLFYSKYDPIEYQKSTKPTGVDKFGFSTVRSFDKFEFRPIGQEEVGRDPNTLYIGTELEIGDKKTLKTINFPNGTPAFKIIGSK